MSSHCTFLELTLASTGRKQTFNTAQIVSVTSGTDDMGRTCSELTILGQKQMIQVTETYRVVQWMLYRSHRQTVVTYDWKRDEPTRKAWAKELTNWEAPAWAQVADPRPLDWEQVLLAMDAGDPDALASLLASHGVTLANRQPCPTTVSSQLPSDQDARAAAGDVNDVTERVGPGPREQTEWPEDEDFWQRQERLRRTLLCSLTVERLPDHKLAKRRRGGLVSTEASNRHHFLYASCGHISDSPRAWF